MEAVEELVRTAFDAGAVDLVVTAYRGNADLLAALLSSAIAREQTMYIVARAGDESLVTAIGRETTLVLRPSRNALASRARGVRPGLRRAFKW